jgi:hypothetical protein
MRTHRLTGVPQASCIQVKMPGDVDADSDEGSSTTQLQRLTRYNVVNRWTMGKLTLLDQQARAARASAGL